PGAPLRLIDDAPGRLAARRADAAGAHRLDRLDAQLVRVDGVVGTLVAADWDLPPVERRLTGGMADDALPVGSERGHHLVRTTGDPLAFGHARPLVRLIGGGADGVEVEIPVPRPSGDRQVAGGGPKFIAEEADRRIGPAVVG